MADSQKFIARNRAPRVQIEYDVEVYGAEKKIQLPFVMGVFSDLAGKSEVPRGSLEDRKFLEIDVDNFDDRMKAMKPRAAFSVPNTLTGEGSLPVDLTFEKMEDFSPAAVAAQVEPLRKLLETRTQLSNLMTYMDGKTGAEDMILSLMRNPAAFQALLSGADVADAGPEVDAILSAMKAAAPTETAASDSADDVLAAVAASAPVDTSPEDRSDAVLAGMAAQAPEEETEDGTADVLAAMAANAPEKTLAEDTAADVLASLSAEALEGPVEDRSGDILAAVAAEPPAEVEGDNSSDVLSALADTAPQDAPAEDAAAGVLDAVRETDLHEPTEDGADDVLAAISEAAPADEVVTDEGARVLADLAQSAPDGTAEEDDDLDGLLSEVAAEAPEELAEDSSDEVLAELAEETVAEPEEDDGVEALLSDVAAGSESLDADEEDLDALFADVTEGAEKPDQDDDDLDALLAEVSAEPEDAVEDEEDLDALLADVADQEIAQDDDDDLDALLSDVADSAEDTPEEEGDLEALLADVSEGLDEEAEDDTDLDALLSDVADDAPEEDEDTDLDALLADVSDDADEDEDDDDLDALLSEVAEETEDETAEEGSDLDALLSGDASDTDDEDLDALFSEDDSDDLDALLADDDGEPAEDDDGLDLDDLLAGEDDPDTAEDGEETDLDALLADDDAGETPSDEEDVDLDDLLSDDEDDVNLDDLLADDGDVDLDDLLSDEGDGEEDTDLDDLLADGDDLDLDDLLEDDDSDGDAAPAEEETPKVPYNPAFGKMTAPKPEINPGDRRKMRIAILGDFSGRANRGALEGGADLAKRKPIKFDIDTVEDVIERFATTLTLPLGKDGSAIEVALSDVDGLHPDELFDKVELFSELRSLRTQIQRGTNLDSVTKQLQDWGAEFGSFRLRSTGRARGASADASMKVSDFAALIGAEPAPRPEPTGMEAMIQRIVAPFVVAAPDAAQESMLAAVDQALSAAMSSILHHPDFQAVEVNWRTLDMIARRVETGTHLEMVLYDVAVEEFTADLAAHEDLGESALYDMLVERPRLDEAQGPLAAVFGMYTFEETPPHAELLARMSKISAQMDAPFVAAMGADFLKTKPDDLHPMVAKTWAAFRETPEAKYIGLAAPRFLLRMPYGKKTEPVDPFDYEEFNTREGMRSLLMGNPAALVMVLLAETLAQQGAEMSLGSIMSVDDMPFHYMTDQYGDQVALPSTERLLNVRMSTETVQRGYMPVLSIQGQNVIRLGSFNALGGGELLGLWAGEEAKSLSAGKIQARTGVSLKSNAAGPEPEAVPAAGGGEDDDEFSMDADDPFGSDDDPFGSDDDDPFADDDPFGSDDDDPFGSDGDLDDLLGGMDDDDEDEDDDDDEMDEDLEALLADL